MEIHPVPRFTLYPLAMNYGNYVIMSLITTPVSKVIMLFVWAAFLLTLGTVIAMLLPKPLSLHNYSEELQLQILGVSDG